MSKEQLTGIWIPANVWLDLRLTLQEKHFLVEIARLSGPDGCCANNAYFAKYFNISTVRVSQVIMSLVRKEIVEWSVLPGQQRTLKCLVDVETR